MRFLRTKKGAALHLLALLFLTEHSHRIFVDGCSDVLDSLINADDDDMSGLGNISDDRRLTVIGDPPGAGAGLDAVADGAYQPQTRILDHQRIGLDFQEMAEKLDSLAFEDALAVYRNGGHSSSVATILLNAPLPTAVPVRSIVLGMSETGETIRGDALTASSTQTTTMEVAYPVTKDGPYCFIGGKANPVTDGCFVSSQSLSVAGQEISGFTYDPLQNTKNLRTLQGLATDSDGMFKDCETCPLETYLKYVNYYGDFAYADNIIMAAFQQTATTLNTANVDFSEMSSDGRNESIQRLTMNLVVWMTVVGMMEHSIETCRIQDPVNNGIMDWDAAVGYYIGTGTNSSSLLYHLADELCQEFGTCDSSGTAAVNQEIMDQLQSGQAHLSGGSCQEAKEIKNRIVSLMTVPIIQGALYYSFLLRGVQDDRTHAAAYSFVAAILPLLNECGSEGVAIVFSSVQIPTSDAAVATDFFPSVKGFMEEQYVCLGVSCQDIGELAGADLCTGMEDDDSLMGNDDEVPSSSRRRMSMGWCILEVLLVGGLSLIL